MRLWGLAALLGVLPVGCTECLIADCDSSQIRVVVIDPEGVPIDPDPLVVRIDGGVERQVSCDERLVCTFYVGGQFETETAVYGAHTYTFIGEAAAVTGEALSGSAEIEIDFDAIEETECCGKQVVRELTVPLSVM